MRGGRWAGSPLEGFAYVSTRCGRCQQGLTTAATKRPVLSSTIISLMPKSLSGSQMTMIKESQLPSSRDYADMSVIRTASIYDLLILILLVFSFSLSCNGSHRGRASQVCYFFLKIINRNRRWRIMLPSPPTHPPLPATNTPYKAAPNPPLLTHIRRRCGLVPSTIRISISHPHRQP